MHREQHSHTSLMKCQRLVSPVKGSSVWLHTETSGNDKTQGIARYRKKKKKMQSCGWRLLGGDMRVLLGTLRNWRLSRILNLEESSQRNLSILGERLLRLGEVYYIGTYDEVHSRLTAGWERRPLHHVFNHWYFWSQTLSIARLTAGSDIIDLNVTNSNPNYASKEFHE